MEAITYNCYQLPFESRDESHRLRQEDSKDNNVKTQQQIIDNTIQRIRLFEMGE